MSIGAEQCDDGNTVNGDGCSTTCTVELGYSCSGSPSNCAGMCGNGIITSGEQWYFYNFSKKFHRNLTLISDPGNTIVLGCDNCKIITGYICSGQPSVCKEICGNYAVTPSEQCDDGNKFLDDGCDSECKIGNVTIIDFYFNFYIESGWNCTGVLSVCVPYCGDMVMLGYEECDDGIVGVTINSKLTFLYRKSRWWWWMFVNL